MKPTTSTNKCSLTTMGYKVLAARYLDGRWVTAESGMMSGCQHPASSIQRPASDDIVSNDH